MGTEVLRPQDLLVERFRQPPTSFPRRRNFPGNGNLTHLVVNRKPNCNTGYRKTSPKSEKKRFNADNGGAKKAAHGGAAETRRKDDGAGGLAMGQVTLLRRGESLDSFTSKMKGKGSAKAKSPKQNPVDDLDVLGTERIGPELPEMVPKQIRLAPPPLADVYAGSAFSLSPSPRSLPLPSFFNKKHQNESINEPVDDSATRDLRRLLRLE